MARFISSGATFEKESLSKEKETDISTVVIYLPREIYIYICVYIYLCGGAKQFACFQVLYRSSKKIPLYSIGDK